MRVWIDQDLCTGDGLCVDHCPDVFVQLEDGIAYVAEPDIIGNDPGGSGSLAWVPPRVRAVIDAAEDCPGECIFIEIDVPIGRRRRSRSAPDLTGLDQWIAARELLLWR
jgi:ferredoxin